MNLRRRTVEAIIYEDSNGLAWLIPFQLDDGTWCVITEDGDLDGAYSSVAGVRRFMEEWQTDLVTDKVAPTDDELATFEAHEALAHLMEELGTP